MQHLAVTSIRWSAEPRCDRQLWGPTLLTPTMIAAAYCVRLAHHSRVWKNTAAADSSTCLVQTLPSFFVRVVGNLNAVCTVTNENMENLTRGN